MAFNSSLINITADVQGVISSLEKMEGDCKKTVQQTIYDIKDRVPAWVRKAVRQEYNVKDGSTIKWEPRIHSGGGGGGTEVDNLVLEWHDRLLTHTHFGMKPTKRPEGKRNYEITATVKKGQKRVLHGKSRYQGMPFLVRSGGEGTKQIPFQREGAHRYPIMAIKTIGLPQMISTGSPENVKPEVMEPVQEKIGKRYAHYVDRLKKKYGMK